VEFKKGNRLSPERKILGESRPIDTSRRIAREARNRIELVASRIPRPANFRRQTAEIPAADRVVVISDTHLGDPLDVLASDRAIDALVEAIKGLGPVDELILLGDIFEFWTSPVNESMARARGLMSALYTLDNVERMIYIPGNHDHHVFRLYYAEQVARRLREGECDPPDLSMPLTDDCPVMDSLKPRNARVPLSMVYPMHQVTVQGREVLVTHGHLLGFFERSLWQQKSSVLGTLLLSKSESLSLEEMEKFVSPFYEMFALSAMVPGVASGGYRVYRLISRTGKLLGLQGDTRASTYRNTTIEENAAEIEALLDYLYPSKPDFFVYGHTHRAGRLTLPLSGVVAINSGCWLSDAGGKYPNTIVEIARDVNLTQVF
jgi:UDP-2,3-diacylglucosamine pyrophosphatase LpxH